METRRLIVTVVCLLIVVLTWDRVFIFIGTKMGYDMTPAAVSQNPTTAPAAQRGAADATGGGSTQPMSMSATTAPSALAVAQAGQDARPADIGSDIPKDATFPLGISLTPRGAGFNSVVLNDYKKTVNTQDPYTFEGPYEDFIAQSTPMATQSITIDGKYRDLSNIDWRLESADAHSAKYVLDLLDQGRPLVRLVKTFQVFDRSDVDNGSGHEVAITETFENRSDHPIAIASQLIGPTVPPREQERGGDRQIISGYLKDDAIELVHHTIEEFSKEKAVKDLTRGTDDAPLAWGGACSAYFDAIVRPIPSKDVTLTKFTAQALVPDADALDHFVTTTFDLAATIPSGTASSFPMRLYLGPKLRSLLKSDYYSRPPLHYDSTLVMTGGPCAYCTSDALISVLVGTLGFFHMILRDWGLAIIALVILVRVCLHPIMKRSQANMMKMGKMGPEIERLKKKYGEDKDAVSKAQMEMMKSQGFTPILGCLPMFLQMPIFIALWSCLQSTFELRQAPFLYFFGIHFTWIKDLAQPDKLIYFPNHPISFLFIHFDALNLLPILVAVVSFINQKVTPKPPAATPEAAQQQKMMQWMTLIFPLMFYNLPSGLNLYYVTSTSIGILEGNIIRKHIKNKEEAERGGRVIVDAKPTRGSRQSKRDEPPKDKSSKTGLMGWLANLQEKAEQLRNESERSKKDKA
jgi:YidC/Oxa1 family membrane protein insertase